MAAQPYFAVIMAGGTGSRLWPLSRKSRPKQFHAFLGGKTLLQETYDRLAAVLLPEHIFISTGTSYVGLIRDNLPTFPESNIILEPEARNTGPAISLAALTISARHPEAIIATIASDHAVKNPEEFQATLLAAFESVEARPDTLVTVGINPTRPDTGFGYIRLGAEWKTVHEKRVFVAEEFKEKPDLATAEEYLRSFDYLWNAGYFIFRAGSIKEWLADFAPALLGSLQSLVERSLAGKLDDTDFAREYGALENIAFDYLIVERLPKESRLVIPSPLEWSDVGNWQTLYEFLSEHSGETSVIHGEHLGLDSRRLFIQGEKRLIATIGVEDLVIVDTPDALLVARRDQAATAVKEIIEKLKLNRPTLL